VTSTVWISLLIAGLLSALGTGLVRWYALRRDLLDHPNDRSSHSVPTPRGGGLAILVSFFVTVLVVLEGLSDTGWPLWLALGGILPTAIVGWMDDHFSLPARVRIPAHLVTAGAMVPLALSGSLPVDFSGVVWLLGAWWIFATVAAINVVNFMDGIDGIIALQAAVFGVHLAVLSDTPQTTAFALAIAGSAGGFLLWNWYPARIFMGDVGSGSLGALGMIGGLLVLREGSVGMIPIFLPLAPLFADATVTLLRRAARGERLWEAHRDHLYQRLANGGWGHPRVTLLYGALAVVGSIVSHAAVTDVWPEALIGYAITILALGVALERKVDGEIAVEGPS